MNTRKPILNNFIRVLGLTLIIISVTMAGDNETGSTKIAKWKDGKCAAFLLMFDDSWPSHFQVAAPALKERNMVATFYINPGKGEYRKFKDEWEQNAWRMGMVYGNHTYAHTSVTNAIQAEEVISRCNTEIIRIQPGKPKHLVSYGQPGVKEWKVSKDEMSFILSRYNLVDRPPFRDHGAVYHLKTTEQMLALADRAIASQGLEYLVIHGVERIKPAWKYQDFWALKQDIFFPLLDGLKERSDQGKLWITDHISAHKYETEREKTHVRLLDRGEHEIQLELNCSADPSLYDEPLTLITQVPSTWKNCTLSQGTNRLNMAISKSAVQYSATPGGGPITLTEF